MTETEAESTLLACPTCGGTSFSWVLHQVQFGSVHEITSGQYSEESRKLGPVTGSDVDENGVFCTSCDKSYERNDLVPDPDRDDH